MQYICKTSNDKDLPLLTLSKMFYETHSRNVITDFIKVDSKCQIV